MHAIVHKKFKMSTNNRCISETVQQHCGALKHAKFYHNLYNT